MRPNDNESRLDRKFTEFAKLMNIYLNHFPKHEKYALSQEIRLAAYGVYSLIIEAQKRYHKKTTLTNLDIRHEQLRMFLRLAHQMGYFSFKNGKTDLNDPAGQAMHRYMAISRLVDELGRIIGGWVAAERLDKREAS